MSEQKSSELSWMEVLAVLGFIGLFVVFCYKVFRNLFWFIYIRFYKPKVALPHSKLCIFSLQFNCITCWLHKTRTNFYPSIRLWYKKSYKYWFDVLDRTFKFFGSLVKAPAKQLSLKYIDYSKYDKLVSVYSDVKKALQELGYNVDLSILRILVLQYFNDKSVGEIVQKYIIAIK